MINKKNLMRARDGEDTVSTPFFPPGAFDPSWSPDDQWIVFEKPTRCARAQCADFLLLVRLVKK
jgi:hypothetical protein